MVFYDARGIAYPEDLTDPARNEVRAPGTFVPNPANADPNATEWEKRYGGGYGSWLSAYNPEYEQWKTGIKPGAKDTTSEFPGGSWTTPNESNWRWDAPRDFEGTPWKSLEGQVTATGDWRPEYTWAEAMNQLIPFMNPNDWQWTVDQLRGLNLDVFNNYDYFGGGQGWNAYDAPRLNQAEEYQYYTQPRISDIANILFGPAVPMNGIEGSGAPFARGEPGSLEYGKGILNWGGEEQSQIVPYIKQALNAAARYAPGGTYVPGARRSMEQQAEYNAAMEDVWNKQMANETQQTEWELWKPFLQRLISPTTNVTPGTYLSQPSARRYGSVMDALNPSSTYY
jgi:hypothetical protein